ncbi:zinc-binding dehydrogenase [Mycobacterium sp. E2462]|uniref:zinc-dependent alcohol dehydrogenase n=1 Tax=Mycobacterium sp. E2462 TaxID=1834133 RepID=UPI0012EA9AFC|nr:alcohol dehydrogenase catalytic domain-containing protein [Mycobacterium sp. E2462]
MAATPTAEEYMRALHFIAKRTIEWREHPDPQIEAATEAIVHPLASTTCDLDRSIIAGAVDFGSDYPIGHECVAEVIAIGDQVRNVEPGDVCVVPWHINCGTCGQCRLGLTAACTAVPGLSGYGAPIGGDWGGLFSDRVRVPFADAMLTKLPPGVDPVRAASCSDNLTDAYVAVWRGLSRRPGAPVLVLNSLPSLGLFAVQHALALGAAAVTFVDAKEERRELARGLGATVFSRVDSGRDHGKYPVVVGAAPGPALLAEAIRCVAPGGHLSNVAMVFGDAPVPLWDMYQRDMTFATGFVSVTPHLETLLGLLGSGRLDPSAVVTEHDWVDAPHVLLEPYAKPVLVAPSLMRA